MQKNHKKQMLSWFLCIVLTAAIAVCTAGCGKTDTEPPMDTENQNVWEDGSVLGEGEKEFALTIMDKEGAETNMEVHTDEETVGAALLALGVIDGEDGDYGLYVKTVNGVTADYETDGVYWAFYINDEYAPTGVDSTEITEGANYSFRIEE